MASNSASTRQQREADKRERLRRLNEDEDLQWVLSDARGRRFLRRLVYDIGGLEKSSYVTNVTGRGSDPTYNEGRRAVAFEVVDEARRVAPALWLTGASEAIEDEFRALPFERDDDLSVNPEENEDG